MTQPSTGDRNRRADAQRNRAAIINAALTCFVTNPRASMSEIAEAAGVGRVTMYGHFSSRRDLIEAVAEETMQEVAAQLAPVNLEGDPRAALERLTLSSWRVLDRFRGLAAAAEAELGGDRLREHHEHALDRVRGLIERGQGEGAFRTDQPARWLAACFFAILHAAPAEIRGGRLSENETADLLRGSVISLVSPVVVGS
jgi:TetR/AcrR family transcriptional regulator, mexCD-oprJ operon repressor